MKRRRPSPIVFQPPRLSATFLACVAKLPMPLPIAAQSMPFSHFARSPTYSATLLATSVRFLAIQSASWVSSGESTGASCCATEFVKPSTASSTCVCAMDSRRAPSTPAWFITP